MMTREEFEHLDKLRKERRQVLAMVSDSRREWAAIEIRLRELKAEKKQCPADKARLAAIQAEIKKLQTDLKREEDIRDQAMDTVRNINAECLVVRNSGASVQAVVPSSMMSDDRLRMADAFFDAFKTMEKHPMSWWPSHFLLTHMIELALKAFLGARGIDDKVLTKCFGHDLGALLDEAQDRKLGLDSAVLADLQELHETHYRLWGRYPYYEDRVVYVIDHFEKSAGTLLTTVRRALRGGYDSVCL
ncbi:hypothetical protein [Azospirillum sp. B506]|uniref:hypothetical protein n=1 Tax=Azospirillum sp. B506 TaxID=137721 RepID=UPI0005B26EC4|nr:hypothetical protein [Azospirillum sp. B506]